MMPLAERRDQVGLGRGQGLGPGARHAGEAVGPAEQPQHRRDGERAGEHPEHQRGLLLPRRGVDQLAGLQVLQVVVGDGADGEDDRGHEQGEGDQRLAGGVADHAA